MEVLIIRKLLKIFVTTVLFLVLLAVLGWSLVPWILSFSVAHQSGEISIKSGLRKKVEIFFDSRAVPQIWAEHTNDLAFALGWVHASERLFQMEVSRRMARGELSEVFGRVALPIDIKQRQLTFLRRARTAIPQLSAEGKQWLTHYCDGINTWIQSHWLLPPEFVLLRYRPRLWRVEDCLALLLYQTWFSHSLMDDDLVYNSLYKKFGIQVIDRLTAFKPWSPVTVSPEHASRLGDHGVSTENKTLGSGSNSWVVSPSRSQSGHALHAADPHLSISRLPGFWFIVGLHCPGQFDVVGITAPGLPFVVMGHSAKIGYAFTVASIDMVDYYQLKRSPHDRNLVWFNGKWTAMRTRKEMIKVKGQKEAQKMTVFELPLGPAIDHDEQSVTFVKWAGFDRSLAEAVTAAYRLPRVTNFEDFRRTVTRFGALDANWTYSDSQGNIGYQLGAPVPVRSTMNSSIVQHTADEQTRWRKYLTLAESAFEYNPSRGWIATCNNQIVDQSQAARFPGYYDLYRIVRADTLLNSNRSVSAKQCHQMQADLISSRALRWKSLLVKAAHSIGDENTATRVSKWDGRASKSSKEAALFNVWWQYLGRELFEDELGTGFRLASVLQDIVLTQNWKRFIDDHRTEQEESIIEIAGRALRYAENMLQKRAWGDICHLQVKHPLGAVSWLDRWLNLNRGPFPYPGDRGTLRANFAYFDWKEQQFHTSVGQSMRFVLDWADVDDFSMLINAGQSGNPLSPHYFDFFPLMFHEKTWNVPFTRKKVEERAVSRLVLRPGS